MLDIGTDLPSVVLPDGTGTRNERRPELLDMALVCCAAGTILYGLDYAPLLVAWLAAAFSWTAFAFRTWTRKRDLTYLDVAVVSWCGYALVSTWWSLYSPNSWLYAEQMAVAAGVYFAISGIRSLEATRSILLLLSGLAILSGVLDCTIFLAKYSQWKALQFGTIWDVKKVLTSVHSQPGGVHYTRYLYFSCFGSVAYCAFEHGTRLPKWLAGTAVGISCVCMLVSLSRGLYLAAGVLFGAGIVFLTLTARHKLTVVPRRSCVQLLLIALVSLGLFGAVKPGVLAGIVEGWRKQSISEDRSVGGRLDLWRSAIDRIDEKPILGHGSGTYSVIGDTGSASDESYYVARAFNLPLQMTFESGLVGCAMMLALFLTAIFSAWRATARANASALQKTISVLCALSICAIFVRELTYNMLFVDEHATVAFFTLLGFIGWVDSPIEFKLFGARLRPYQIASLAALAVGVTLLYMRTGRARMDQFLLRSAQAANGGHYQTALELSERAAAIQKSAAVLAQESLLRAKVAGLNANGDLPARLDTGDTLSKSIRGFEQALADLPVEGSWWCDLALLRWAKGDSAGALDAAHRAQMQAPDVAMYRQVLVSMLLDKHEQSAQTELSATLARFPEVLDAQWWRELSVTSADVGKQALFTAATQLKDEGSPLAMARRGRLLLAEGQDGTAEQLLKRALTSLPNLAGAWRNLAKVLIRRGHYSEADVALRRALFLAPNDYRAMEALGRLLKGTKVSAEKGRGSAELLEEHAQQLSQHVGSAEADMTARKFHFLRSIRDDVPVNGLLRRYMPTLESP